MFSYGNNNIITLSNVFVLLQVAEEIWVCEKGAVTKWQGGILKYKEHLKNKIINDCKKK